MKHIFSLFFTLAFAFIPATDAFSDVYAPIQISLVPGLALPFNAKAAGIVVGSIGNVSGRVDLLQAAGVFNIADDLRGIQTAGVFNIADNRDAPLQLAGVFNIAKGVEGLQSAGVFNVSGRVQGAQFAGVFNVADDVDGFQVGLINIADRVKGIQLGLINISSNGVFDISGNWEAATGLARATFKTGNTSVFAEYSLAAPKDELFKYYGNAVVSAGLGTRIGNQKFLYLDLSVSASQALGPDPSQFIDAWHHWNGVEFADILEPWPTVDASLTLNLGGIHLTGGLRADVSLASAPNMPAFLAKGMPYSDTWFGESFTAWTKWYLGVGF